MTRTAATLDDAEPLAPAIRPPWRRSPRPSAEVAVHIVPGRTTAPGATPRNGRRATASSSRRSDGHEQAKPGREEGRREAQRAEAGRDGEARGRRGEARRGAEGGGREAERLAEGRRREAQRRRGAEEGRAQGRRAEAQCCGEDEDRQPPGRRAQSRAQAGRLTAAPHCPGPGGRLPAGARRLRAVHALERRATGSGYRARDAVPSSRGSCVGPKLTWCRESSSRRSPSKRNSS